MILKVILWSSLALVPAALVAGTQSNNAAGSQAAPWLLLDNDARTAAMGDVSAALIRDVDALGTQPAGLAGIKQQQFSASQNLWVQQTTVSHLAYGISLMPGSALALGLNYQNFGSIDKYSLSSTGTLVPNGTANPNAYDIDLGWGQDLGMMGLSLGLDLKALSQSLDAAASTAFAADLGIQWSGPAGLKLGVVEDNVGSQLAGANLPMITVLGLGYAPATGDAGGLPLSVGVDVDLPSQGDVTVGFGGEYWLKDVLALRLGYHTNSVATNDLSVSGLTAGLGLKASWMEVDYAYRALGDLGMSNQFSLLATF